LRKDKVDMFKRDLEAIGFWRKPSEDPASESLKWKLVKVLANYYDEKEVGENVLQVLEKNPAEFSPEILSAYLEDYIDNDKKTKFLEEL